MKHAISPNKTVYKSQNLHGTYRQKHKMENESIYNLEMAMKKLATQLDEIPSKGTNFKPIKEPFTISDSEKTCLAMAEIKPSLDEEEPNVRMLKFIVKTPKGNGTSFIYSIGTKYDLQSIVNNPEQRKQMYNQITQSINDLKTRGTF